MIQNVIYSYLFKYSLQTITHNFKGSCHQMSVLFNTQKHQPHITLKTKSKSILPAVLLCYLPLLDRETLHQTEPDLKFLSSHTMHGFYTNKYEFYYHCICLHRLMQNTIQFQKFSFMTKSRVNAKIILSLYL